MNRGTFQTLRRNIGTALCAFALVCSSFSPPAFAAQDATFEAGYPTFSDHHKALKDDKSLQFELAEPKFVEKKKSRASPGMRAFGAAVGGLIKIAFYVMLGVLIATLVYYIVREFIHFRFPAKREGQDAEGEEPPLYVPDADEAQILLDDVDRLAGSGNFADAIHTLLFRSIQDIEEKRPHSIRQSFTSREIGALKILSPEARTAFSQIGRVVEEGFFGRRPLGKTDFETCRAAYVQFTRPKVWS